MSEQSTPLLDYIDIVDRPIAADNFAGDDCRYEPDFEQLEQSCHNPLALHHDVKVDWPVTVALACTFLRERAKDLRVAVWLTWALQRSEGWAGLYAGLALLERLLEMHWEALHPRRERTREAALQWLAERLDGLFDDTALRQLELPRLESLAAQLGRLAALLARHEADAADSMQILERRLQEQQRRCSQPVAAVAAPTPDATPTAAAVSLSQAPESERAAHRLLRQMQDAARGLGSWWLKQRAGDPRALRLNRALLWAGIDALPSHDAQGRTGLRGLPADRLRFFQERKDTPAELLVELETSLLRAPFWLDGQRLAWECLHALGAEAGCREIEWPLALLLARLPGLEALAFHDGQPFADDQTRSWLAGLGTTPAAAVETSAVTAATDAAWTQALAEAVAELAAQGVKPALRRLQSGRASARGGRERLLWDLACARLLIQARQYEVALLHLGTLDQDLAGPLGDWEPQLALEVLQLRRQCLEALPANADTRQQLQQLRPRLCRLDLEAALA